MTISSAQGLSAIDLKQEKTRRPAGAAAARIAVNAGTATTEGTAEALDADGQLLLRLPDGTLQVIGAGEATIVRQA